MFQTCKLMGEQEIRGVGVVIRWGFYLLKQLLREFPKGN